MNYFKLLHTADLHLGQIFCKRERINDQKFMLNEIIKIIVEEEPDALVVSGDIFDVGNPPNYAIKMYYEFLMAVRDNTKCKNIFLTAGNHDLPSTLLAPKVLMDALNFYLVAKPSDELQENIFIQRNKNDEPKAIFALVPFIRERDIVTPINAESIQDRGQRIKEGIKNHYKKLAEHIQDMILVNQELKNIPIITTGHLFATGSKTLSKQDNIYQGNIENIEENTFPELFDYVALGHIHLQQPVGGKKHIRYSGSPMALNFEESEDKKGVLIVNFKDGKFDNVNFKVIPPYRQLISIIGNLSEIEDEIQGKIDQKMEGTPWIDLTITNEVITIVEENQINELGSKLKIEFLAQRQLRKLQQLQYVQNNLMDLQELQPLDVFKMKCQSEELDEETEQELVKLFKIIEEKIEVQDED
jgi:DNA repair protein SbcD/Mre11